MASEPFTIQFESFDGGLSQGGYTGGDNQYAAASLLDYSTEPGTLVGAPRLTEIEITTGASYRPAVLDVFRSSSASKDYPALVATNSSYTLATVNLNSDGTLTQLAVFDTYYMGLNTYFGRAPTPLAEYANDLFTISAGSIIQQTDYASSASYVTNSPVNGLPSDLVENFGYLYGSIITTSNASPGHIWRYDASSSSLITTGAAILDPAVQLAIGWSPICMENYGDYIAILANQSSSVDCLDWTQYKNSRLYIWDGVSNSFDKKVDIQGQSMTAIHTHLGQLYGFSSTIGGIDILRYAGGDSFQKVGRIPINLGSADTGIQDIMIPWVRKQSISSYGTKIYIGVMHDGNVAAQGNLFSFDTATGVVDRIYGSNSKSAHTAFFCNEMQVASFQQFTNASLKFMMAAAPFKTAPFDFATLTRRAPAGKKMKINRVHLYHSYLRDTDDRIRLYLNYNLADSVRGYGSAQIADVSGSSLSVPGVGTASAYEHIYTFQQTDGTPIPLLDSFALSVLTSLDSTNGERIRIFLPITVEGEYIDSPN